MCFYISSRDDQGTQLVYEVQVKMKETSQVNVVYACIHCNCDTCCLHFPFSNDWMEFAQSYTVIAQYNCCAIGCIRYCLLVFILITCKCNIELDVYMFWVPWVAVYIFSRIFWKIWYSMILDGVWIGGKADCCCRRALKHELLGFPRLVYFESRLWRHEIWANQSSFSGHVTWNFGGDSPT